MIPIPQDIPGAITIIFVVWWFRGFKVAKDVMDEKPENDATHFFMTLAITTMLLISLRIFVAWIWC